MLDDPANTNESQILSDDTEISPDENVSIAPSIQSENNDQNTLQSLLDAVKSIGDKVDEQWQEMTRHRDQIAEIRDSQLSEKQPSQVIEVNDTTEKIRIADSETLAHDIQDQQPKPIRKGRIRLKL